MRFFMVAASHSPLLDFPARESASVVAIRAALGGDQVTRDFVQPDPEQVRRGEALQARVRALLPTIAANAGESILANFFCLWIRLVENMDVPPRTKKRGRGKRNRAD